MKNCFSLILLLLFCLSSMAQEKAPKERYTYVWDVTRSMVGYGDNNPDIYDEVRELIIKDIKKIPESIETEICVVAFRGGLEGKGYKVWKAVADRNGKKHIEKVMNDFETTEDDAGITNTYTALKHVVDNILSPQTMDYLKIMTDGGCDEYDSLKAMFSEWCETKKEKKVFAYYITLTDKARESVYGKKGKKGTTVNGGKRPLIEYIDTLCLKPIANMGDVDYVRQLSIVSGPTYYNLLTDKGKQLTYTFEIKFGNGKIEPGLKLHCKTRNSDNDIFVIDEVVEFDVNTNSITLTPKVNEFAHHAMEGDENKTVYLEFTVANSNEKRFSCINIEPQVHYIVLQNQEQTLTVTNKDFEYQARSSEPKLKPSFKVSNGEIKPGFKVDYHVYDPRGLFGTSGTAEIDDLMRIVINLDVNPEARNSSVVTPKVKHEGAKLILSPNPQNSEEYKNVTFEECEFDVFLINNTIRRVKIYVK